MSIRRQKVRQARVEREREHGLRRGPWGCGRGWMMWVAVTSGEDFLMCRVGLELQWKRELCETETGSLRGWWQEDEDSGW